MNGRRSLGGGVSNGLDIGASIEPQIQKLKECSVSRRDLINVSQWCPQRPYIELQVPEDCKRVQSTQFRIRSRDQGWCDTDASLKPYARSYTWFTAHVQRGNGQNDPHHEHVQTNRRGNPEFATHRKTWHAGYGSSSKSPFVSSLRPGDVVQLFPRAFYLCWVNIVESATMKLLYFEGDTDLVSPSLDRFVDSASVYQPLLDGEIRVLQVEPGQPDEPIHCSMILHQLVNEKDHPFEALSYCWGAVDRESIIYLSGAHRGNKDAGREFRVAGTVLSALRHLRLSNDIRRLWIDAICINQADFDERSRQVSMMSKIFPAASQVNVWLGEHDPGSIYGMKMIQEMYNSRHRYCPGSVNCRCEYARHTREPTNDEANFVEEIETIYKEAYPEFRSAWGSFPEVANILFGNPWFRRVWVLQEVLIPETVVVHCRYQQMPWKELIDIGEYMNEHLYIRHASPAAALPTVWSTLRKIINKRTNDSEPQAGFFEIFLEALELEASDPRDKVWALLAFGAETNPINTQQLSDRIRPDYTKPVAQMFADFTRWCILAQNSLRILSTVHGLRGRTWQSLQREVAARSPVFHPTWAAGSMGDMKWARATLQHRFNYKAAGDTVFDTELIENPTDPAVLSLKGFRITQIRHIGHPSIQQSLEIRPNLFEAFVTIYDLTRTQETWVAGRMDQIQSESPMFDFENRFREHQEAHWCYGARPMPTVIQTDETTDATGDIHAEEEESIPSCIDPCFFVGDNRWCGLCPSGAQIGDMAVILLGAEVPFLLRQSTESDGQILFEFVGECYIEGAMNGEVVEASAANHVLPETFSLI